MTAPAVLKVNEIFHSIQGESTRAGRPCTFVRLTACNLRCGYCDTEYAFYEGRSMTVDEILEEVGRRSASLAEVTGGEPLLQEGVYELLDRLGAAGYEVLLETSGSVSTARVPSHVGVILDVKTPGSGMAEKNRWENLDRLASGDEVKFVLCDRRDYEWAADVVERHRLDRRVPVLFSPVHGVLDPGSLAEWILADGLPVRLQLQIHKYLWTADTRR